MKVAYQIVKNGNLHKFQQNPHLRKELFKTQGRTMVEASPYDTIWGIGLEADDPLAQQRSTWKGTNLLGQALTEVREELLHNITPTLKTSSTQTSADDLTNPDVSYPPTRCKAVKVLSELAKKQQADVNLKPVYQILQRKVTVTEEHHKQVSWETKRLLQMIDHMALLEDGTMVTRIPIRGRRRQLIICPAELRKELVAEKHAQAHLGVNKTIARITLDWHWPGLTKDIRHHVNSCTTCQQAKTVKTKSSGQKQHLYVGRPWQQCAVDLVGPFQETTRGNSWILVIADHFTRWCDGIPLPDATAATVATALDERIFSYLGVPEVIHTDQGSQFQSDLFEACCKLWGSKKTRTAPYTPTGNSVVERGNKVIGASLRALILDHQHQEWDLLLPQIMRTVRATPHTTTGETPNYMMLGRETRLPESLTCSEATFDTFTAAEYVQDLKRRMEVVRQELQNCQTEIIVTECSEEPPLYTVGDKVWLKSFYKKRGKSQKLLPKYIGPYVITEVLPHHVYRMEKGGKSSVQHEGRIRLHVENKDQRAAGSTLNSTDRVPLADVVQTSKYDDGNRQTQAQTDREIWRGKNVPGKRLYSTVTVTVTVTAKQSSPQPVIPPPRTTQTMENKSPSALATGTSEVAKATSTSRSSTSEEPAIQMSSNVDLGPDQATGEWRLESNIDDPSPHIVTDELITLSPSTSNDQLRRSDRATRAKYPPHLVRDYHLQF